MPFDPDRIPDLGPDNLRIHNDLNNPAHDPHYDIMTGIPGGTDKIRITPSGDIIGGETNIGPVKMPWEP